MATAVLEDLSILLRPSYIPTQYMIYMFKPAMEDTSMKNANETGTPRYLELQTPCGDFFPNLFMDSVFYAVLFTFLFGGLQVVIRKLFPVYFHSLGKISFL